MSACIYYRKLHKWKYMLTHDYRHVTVISGAEYDGPYVSLNNDGVLTLYSGYAWDGMSYAPDWREALRASLVHDALYQLIGLGVLTMDERAYADTEFKRILIEDGVSPSVAAICWYAVHVAGGPIAAHEDPTLDDEYTAPGGCDGK